MEMLEHFDWYYQFSDDHSVWSSASQRKNKIQRELFRQLKINEQKTRMNVGNFYAKKIGKDRKSNVYDWLKPFI